MMPESSENLTECVRDASLSSQPSESLLSSSPCAPILMRNENDIENKNFVHAHHAHHAHHALHLRFIQIPFYIIAHSVSLFKYRKQIKMRSSIDSIELRIHWISNNNTDRFATSKYTCFANAQQCVNCIHNPFLVIAIYSTAITVNTSDGNQFNMFREMTEYIHNWHVFFFVVFVVAVFVFSAKIGIRRLQEIFIFQGRKHANVCLVSAAKVLDIYNFPLVVDYFYLIIPITFKISIVY